MAEKQQPQQQQEVDYTLNNPDTLTKYKIAGEISGRVLAKVKELAVDGANIMELCVEGDKLLEQEISKVYKGKSIAKGIAFPTAVSPNNVASHLSPVSSDEEASKLTIKKGDLIKITLGAQIDGFGSILADTIVVGEKEVSGRKADVIAAAWYASELAIRLVRPGNKNWQVTDAVNKVSADFDCKPLEGMLSHQQSRNVVDGKKQIILNPTEGQKAGFETVTFEEGEVYGLDILISTGDGKVKKEEVRTTIYKKADLTYQLKLKASRTVFSEVQKKFGAFPFNIRYLDDEKKARMGLQECAQHQLLIPHEVVYEKDGEYVAQFFTTFAVTKNGNVKLAAPANLDLSKVHTEKKVKDDEFLKILSTPLKKAAKKKNNNNKKTTTPE